jgi:hypothetical protein
MIHNQLFNIFLKSSGLNNQDDVVELDWLFLGKYCENHDDLQINVKLL